VLYAIDEFLRSVLAVRIWWAISLDDVMGRYRRTLLGPAWMILAQVMWIGGIYLLHSKFFGASAPNYMSYLAAGLAVWALISGLTADATGALLRAKGHIESYPLPMPIHLLRSVTGSFITFLHLILVFVGTMILERVHPSITMVAALPGLAIVAVFGIGVQLALAPIGTRFRDIGPAVTSILNLVFILTPVFWVPSETQLNNSLIVYNPFYYLLEVVRAPLLGSWGTPNLWLVASCIAAAALAAGLLTYARMRATIIYWL
jgi:ABC-type polysaccharide/polyol phosphate export permease